MFENIYEAESAIQELIKNDNNCSAHFKYTTMCKEERNILLAPNFVQLELVTYNPKHKTHFLLHSLCEKTKLAAANALYKHIFDLKQTLEKPDSGYVNYTIEWGDKKDGKTRYSSFYGVDLEDVVRKFYYGKSKKALNVFNVKLNPIS